MTDTPIYEAAHEVFHGEHWECCLDDGCDIDRGNFPFANGEAVDPFPWFRRRWVSGDSPGTFRTTQNTIHVTLHNPRWVPDVRGKASL